MSLAFPFSLSTTSIGVLTLVAPYQLTTMALPFGALLAVRCINLYVIFNAELLGIGHTSVPPPPFITCGLSGYAVNDSIYLYHMGYHLLADASALPARKVSVYMSISAKCAPTIFCVLPGIAYQAS